MGLFSVAKLFGITIRESANDGSDFTNPDADYRRLFLGEDGSLHLKDSAGSVTDIGAAGSVAADAIWDAAGDTVIGTGANTAARRKNAVAQTASPTVNDDSGDGYEVGSYWYDTTNDEVWVCMDVTVGAAVWKEITPHTTFLLGPYYINDLPGTATTAGVLLYMNTSTAVSQGSNEPVVAAAGKVIGLFINSDAGRTAGTATARVRVATTGTDFDGGSVQLTAGITVRDSSIVPRASGVAFAAGNALGVDVVTSGWTPTTANLVLYLLVSLD